MDQLIDVQIMFLGFAVLFKCESGLKSTGLYLTYYAPTRPPISNPAPGSLLHPMYDTD